MLRKNSNLLQSLFMTLFLASTWAVPAASESVDGLSSQQLAALEARVRERWQTLSARDYESTWEFSTPLYRSIFPKDLYVLQFSYTVERELTGVEVLNYDASAAVASVTARVMSKPLKLTSTASRSIGALPVTVHEKWILIDGEWWFSTDV